MKFETSIGSDVVKAEFTPDEFMHVMNLLNPNELEEPATQIFSLTVDSFTTEGKTYDTLIWADSTVGLHGSCTCPDHEYRDRWCKHLLRTLTELPDSIVREGMLTHNLV